MNVILAYPVSLPNREMQFEVLGKDILGRVVVRPIIEGCSACSDRYPIEVESQAGNVQYSGPKIEVPGAEIPKPYVEVVPYIGGPVLKLM